MSRHLPDWARDIYDDSMSLFLLHIITKKEVGCLSMDIGTYQCMVAQLVGEFLERGNKK